MVEYGEFEGNVPQAFSAECLSDGSLILRAVSLPEGIVLVSAIPAVYSMGEDDVEGEDVYGEEEEPGSSRRKLVFDSDGSVVGR
jgi:hypothetical protein